MVKISMKPTTIGEQLALYKRLTAAQDESIAWLKIQFKLSGQLEDQFRGLDSEVKSFRLKRLLGLLK